MSYQNWAAYQSGLSIASEVAAHPLTGDPALHIFGTEGMTYLMPPFSLRRHCFQMGVLDTEYCNEEASDTRHGFFLCMMSQPDVRNAGSAYQLTWCTCENTITLFRISGGLQTGTRERLAHLRVQSYAQRFAIRFMWIANPLLFGQRILLKAWMSSSRMFEETNTTLMLQYWDDDNPLLVSQGEAIGGVIHPAHATQDLYFGTTTLHAVTLQE